jgi:hypothetical protein
MGLISLSDKQDLLSTQIENKVTSDKIVESVKDLFVNKTAISPSRYNGIYSTLMEFNQGFPIEVEYYHKHISYIEKQSGDSTLSFDKSNVDSSYTLVHKFEFKLKEPYNIEYNQETGEMSVHGSGIFYPGLEPNISDCFLSVLQETQIGLFVIDNVQRLSINNNTYYDVQFHLYSLVTEDILDKLSTFVVEELYFDKQKYLSDEVVLLKSESYLNLLKLKNIKVKL